jgi:phage host-nuclease inhibitor protein Gam
MALNRYLFRQSLEIFKQKAEPILTQPLMHDGLSYFFFIIAGIKISQGADEYTEEPFPWEIT